MEKLKPVELLKQGYTAVQVEEMPDDMEFSPFPINIIGNSNWEAFKGITTDSPPDFILQKDGVPVYALVNGFIYDLVNDQNLVKNGQIYN